ncbi:MAG: hypothetical protein ABI041_07980 [Bdellovibrionia bacterium]
MSMSKRFQIPASSKDIRLIQTAARRAGLSAAEWARRLLRREAESQLKAKSWDRLFSELRSLPDPGEWEPPKRDIPRKIATKKDDWA